MWRFVYPAISGVCRHWLHPNQLLTMPCRGEATVWVGSKSQHLVGQCLVAQCVCVCVFITWLKLSRSSSWTISQDQPLFSGDSELLCNQIPLDCSDSFQFDPWKCWKFVSWDNWEFGMLMLLITNFPLINHLLQLEIIGLPAPY